MRILIVSQYFWPENFRINDLAAGLAEKGHRVSVLTGKPNYPGGRFFPGYSMFGRSVEAYRGVEVVRVPLIPRGKGGRLALPFNYLSFALMASVLGPFRCPSKYDVIFVYEPSPVTVGLPAIVMKKIKGAPILFWVQDLWPESLAATGAVKSPVVIRGVERLVRFIYRNSDWILVQSRAFRPSIEQLGVGASRIRYYPNSAEGYYMPVHLEEDDPERKELPDGFRVMFAGNIGEAQDFATILDAAENLKGHPDIKWVILGDGRMRTWVETRIRELGLSGTVHLLGSHPPESMPRFFAAADSLLVTLRKEPIFSLTIPSKVQTYLACARPIVAALDGEGARVIDEAGAGITCRAGDPKALAGAVLGMYRKTGREREEMGCKGRKYFEEQFERGMLIDRLDGWMKEIVEQAAYREAH